MAAGKQPPKSRLNIKYETKVDGVLKKKELPYKVLLMGDLSKGSSSDSKSDYANRNIRAVDQGVNNILSDMDISLDLKVPNFLSKNGGEIHVDYKIDSMKDFKPDAMAEKVPEIKSLLALKESLISLAKEIDNNRNLKKIIDQTFSNEDDLNVLRGKIPNLDKYAVNDITKED
jgi:type VI secretion system protein ImpB